MSAGRASLWFGVLLGFVSPLAEAAGSSVGIDIGGANSVIATARNGGIDVIVNEASRRQTPSMVGFNDQQRLLGQSAMSQQTSRPEDTVAEIKALLGLTFEMARQVTPTPTAHLRQLDTDDGRAEDCAVEVHLRGEARCFSATQLLAMLLYQLQRCSALELGTPPSECTIAVPMHFSAAKRRAVLDAAQIAGFRDARLISDGAAVALDYALGRQNLPTSSDYHVAFVDAGYAGVQVCIAAVRRDSAKLLSHAYAPDVGGAALDDLVCKHMNEDFLARFGVNALEQQRSATRLRLACEKLRRVLSANEEATTSLDCLVGDVDVSGRMTRSDFEAIAKPLLGRVVQACQEALAASGLEPGTLDVVELVGGCSRTPAFEDAIRTALNAPTARTVNSEESVARGAALASAMRSHGVKTRPFTVDEGLLQAGRVRWKNAEGKQLEKVVTLPKGSRIPFTERIALRPTKKEIHLSYTQDLSSERPDIVWTINPPPQSTEVQVEISVDETQLPCVTCYELREATETLGEGLNATLDEENATLAESGGETRQEVSVHLSQDLGLSDHAMQDAVKTEELLRQHDADVEATLSVKNELEASIYSHRTALAERLSAYVSEHELGALRDRLDSLEEWLYGDGEHETLACYSRHLHELATAMEPIESLCGAHTAARSSLIALEQEHARLTEGLRELNSTGSYADEDHAMEEACDRARALVSRASTLLLHSSGDALHAAPGLTAAELQRETESLRTLESELAAFKLAAAEASATADATEGPGLLNEEDVVLPDPDDEVEV